MILVSVVVKNLQLVSFFTPKRIVGLSPIEKSNICGNQRGSREGTIVGLLKFQVLFYAPCAIWGCTYAEDEVRRVNIGGD